MSTLSLQSVELTTSQSTAPLNGPPSSADYNEYQRSVLVDLASLSETYNNILLPLIAVLSSTALGTPNIGVMGSTVFSDTTDQTDTFYDSVEDQPLVIADSLRVLRALIAQLQTNFLTLSVQLAGLQSQSTGINQNAIAASLASLVTQIESLTATVSSEALAISTLQTTVNQIEGTTVTTGALAANSTTQVTVNLTTPYSDNNYIVSLALQDSTGQLQILSFTYQPAGAGILVLVKNNSTTTAITGTINVITKYS